MIPCFVRLPATTGVKIVNVHHIRELQGGTGGITLVCFPDSEVDATHKDPKANKSYLKVQLPLDEVERCINNSIVATAELWAEEQAIAFARHNA